MKSKTPDASPRRLWQSLAPAMLVVAACVAYWPCLKGGFIWDDETLITQNTLVKAADGLHRMWFTTEPFDYWPLTNSLWWLEWRLWGMNPLGYHVINLMLHVGNALLVWTLLRRLMMPGALLAGLIFALHPVNVESVAWIAQGKNTVSMFFFLLSILFWVKQEFGSTAAVPPDKLRNVAKNVAKKDRDRASSAPREARQGSHAWYWLSLVAFMLAMLAKGSVVILPGVLLILAWWRRGTVARADLVRTAPFFLAAIALTLVNVWFQNHGSPEAIRHATFLQRALGAGAVVWFYLFKALLPVHLIFVYPQWNVQPHDFRWWGPLAATGAVTAWLLWQRQSRWGRPALFAWMFYGLALLPVMGFTDVYFMKYSLVADHYQYIAILAVCASAAAVVDLGLLLPARASGALTAGIGALLACLTWTQAHQYVNAETLYRATLDLNPACWMAHNNLAGVLDADHRTAEAIPHYVETVRLAPLLVLPRINLGNALLSQGRTADAIRELTEALRLEPANAKAHGSLGHALALAGQTTEAIAHLSESARLAPELQETHNNLGVALDSQGRTDEAIVQYTAALAIDPGWVEVRNNLGAALASSGRLDEGVVQFVEAIRINPDYADAHRNLGLARMQQHRSDDAIREFQEALRVAPGLADVHYDLAVLLSARGATAEAIRHLEIAVQLDPGDQRARRLLDKLRR